MLLPGTPPPEWEKPALSCWVDASGFCLPLALRNPGLIYIYLGGLNYRTSTASCDLYPRLCPHWRSSLNSISFHQCCVLLCFQQTKGDFPKDRDSMSTGLMSCDLQNHLTYYLMDFCSVLAQCRDPRMTCCSMDLKSLVSQWCFWKVVEHVGTRA